ncbi:hypothetical protein EC988_006479 [Linderina pennispora]|nr:hypothetical protein EC988_006479 [Linderina pennispora]
MAELTKSKLESMRDIAEKIADAHSITGAWFFLEALLAQVGITHHNGYTFHKRIKKLAPGKARPTTKNLRVSIHGVNIIVAVPAFGDIEYRKVRGSLMRCMTCGNGIPVGLLLNPAQLTVFKIDQDVRPFKPRESDNYDVVDELEMVIEFLGSLRRPDLEERYTSLAVE